MVALIKLAKQALTDRKGVTALEYGVIAGVVVLAVITGMTGLGAKVTAVFTSVVAGLPG